MDFKSLEDVRAAIQAGDKSVATDFAKGKFKHLPQSVSEEPREDQQAALRRQGEQEHAYAEGVQEEAPVSHTREPVQEEGEEASTEGQGEQVQQQENSLESDNIEAQRRLHDEQEKIRLENERRVKESEKRMQEIQEQAESREKELQTEIKKIKEELAISDSEEETRGKLEKIDKLEANASDVTNDLSDSDVQKQIEELKTWKEQMEREKSFRSAVDRYESFWNSDIGQELRPSTSPKQAIESLSNFYSDLSEKLGGSGKALRLMSDIAKYGRDIDKDKVKGAGLSVPPDFEKVFKSYEVELFAEGKKIDPVSGNPVPVNGNNFSNLEDAYMLMAKKDPALASKKKAIKDVQSQLSKRSNSAVTPNPSDYRPHETKNKFQDRGYRRQVLMNAQKNGLDHTLNPKKILNQDVREEFVAMQDFLKSL